MRRRDLLAGAPVIGLLVAFDARANEGAESIVGLFRIWAVQHDAMCKSSIDISDEEINAQCTSLRAIEHAMMHIPPKTAEEFAMKLVVATDFGSYPLDGPASVLLHDAKPHLGYWPESYGLEPFLCAG